MSRSVPFFGTALRAVALAAVLGGQTACVRAVPVLAPTRSGNASASFEVAASLSATGASATGASATGASATGASATRASATGASVTSASTKLRSSDESEATRVVVRDYWNAFSASVVAWNDDEEYQGLRTSILRDGTVAYDHVVYFNAWANPRAFGRSYWYAFSDAEKAGHQLQRQGIAADQFNCVGKKGCSPLLTNRARISDELLRRTRDSLVVKVVSLSGYEEVFAIPGTLISSYLATVDSLSAVRKAKSKARSHHQ